MRRTGKRWPLPSTATVGRGAAGTACCSCIAFFGASRAAGTLTETPSVVSSLEPDLPGREVEHRAPGTEIVDAEDQRRLLVQLQRSEDGQVDAGDGDIARGQRAERDRGRADRFAET